MTSTNAPIGVHSHGPPVFDGQPAVGAIRQGWYRKNVESIGDDEQELLEKYSGLKREDVLPHVLAMRDKAFDIWSYACIGQMRFISFNLRRLPFYGEVLERLRSGATFCDAGCCFGQELRHITYHGGIDSAQLYGFDLEQAFIETGYELFLDRGRLKSTFVAGNVLAAPDSEEGRQLVTFDGKMDIVFCSSFLHVFDWDQMVLAVKRLVALTKPRAGSLVVSKQLGSVNAGRQKMPTSSGFNYRHNAESIKRFWVQVGEETGTRWDVEADIYEGLWELGDNQNHAWSEPNQRMLWFKAKRQ